MTLELALPIADPKTVAKADPGSAADRRIATARINRVAPDIARAESEGTLVLVADDHPTNRKLLVRQVNMLGYAAESVENGVEALAKWRSGRFGLVITDCNMPEMDGYELTRTIRELQSASGAKRIPIIACTANALGGEAETCIAAGMDDYLAKPVELKDLSKKLDQWLPLAPAKTNAPQQDASAPIGAPEQAAPVDRSVLAAISGGDVAAELEILADFRRVNDADAVMLELAVEKRDTPQISNASHRIKGASRTVGANALAAACEHLERASAAQDWKTIEANMGAFQRELARVNAYCDRAKWLSPS
jgi:CheY-like chemotaxis protein/HPt (histidine-containing phosphotransfer) domain-containing protein